MTSMAEAPPRLTIVIPTVNRASLVTRAIDSALAQTYPDIEIIVSNNGSTDNTKQVLDRYRSAPRLKINHIQKTIPVNPHGNVLLDMSRGELFLGLSDDDWIEPDFAAKVIELYDRHPNVSFVWTGCLVHYADVTVPAKIGPEIEAGSDFFAAFLANQRNICWCACVTRTMDLRRIGHIPTDVICGDMFYWTKLGAAGPVGCVPEVLSHYVCYRERSDGIAGGASVVRWAREMNDWASDMVTVYEKYPSRLSRVGLARRNAAIFVARSTANQFVWNRLRGVSPLVLLKSLPPTLTCLRRGSPASWIRVIASLIVPRALLRKGVLQFAKLREARPGTPPEG